MPWARDTGLVSIWIAGTFSPSPSTIIVLPFRAGREAELGPVGQRPVLRPRCRPIDLLVKGNAIYFRGDGQQRGKIGVSPRRARPVLGSYDADRQVLTLVTYSLPALDHGAPDYVNSLWEHQREPYRGDVAQQLQRRPARAGRKSPSAPSTSSSRRRRRPALAPGESAEHVHRTMHFVGAPADLDEVARAALGVGLADITAAFSR